MLEKGGSLEGVLAAVRARSARHARQVACFAAGYRIRPRSSRGSSTGSRNSRGATLIKKAGGLALPNGLSQAGMLPACDGSLHADGPGRGARLNTTHGPRAGNRR
jgi:hypothetical protein